MAAAKAVALSSPTPTPFSKAWVARVPVMELAKAYNKYDVTVSNQLIG